MTIFTDRAQELRSTFDASFTRAAAPPAADFESFLAIRIGSDPYALRLTEVSHLGNGKTYTPVPSAITGLLGITALRSNIVAVYDLRVLLGYPADGTPRWMIISTAEPTFGLAFDIFEGHRRVSPDLIATSRKNRSSEPLGPTVPRGQADGSMHRSVIHDNTDMRPVVEISLLIETINSQVQHRTQGR